MLTWVVFCIGPILGCPAAGLAASAADWTALSTTVFRSVGEVSGTSVTALTQDGNGFLWVGGQSGLSRYDGYRFHSYRPDAQVPGSIPDTDINVLHTDRLGRLWIGMSSALARYDPAGDDFVTYAEGPTGLDSGGVNALADDDANGLWIGTSNGLAHLIGRTGTFEHFRHDPRQPGSLPDNAVQTLLLDDRGTLWIGTAAGFVRRDPATGRFIPVALPTRAGQHAQALSIIQDGSGEIWIGTKRDGVYVIPPGRYEAQPLRVGSDHAGALLATSAIQAICEIGPGEIWFGTIDSGVAWLDVATRRLRWLQSDPAVATSLPQNLVLAIYRDRSGLVWVGTLSGLRRSDPRQRAIATAVVGSNHATGITDSDVTSIFGAANDRAWLGFVGHGVDIVDPIRGRIASLRPDHARPQATLPEITIRAIAGFPHGPMFFGTGRGLYATDGDGRGLRRIAMPGTGSDHIDSLCVIDGVLWIGTNSSGVWRLDRGLARPRRLQLTGLSKEITVIAPAMRGHVWVGTYGGLRLLDVRSGAVERITTVGPDVKATSDWFIGSLVTDRSGRLWVGTFGAGIQILTGLGPSGKARFIQLSTREGLPNPNVDSMLADRQGRIWAATDEGMAVIDSATLAIDPLTRADGVEFSNYYLGARTTLGNGDMLFGSTGGLTIVRPALVRRWTYAPPIVMTDVRVGGKTIPAGSLSHAAIGPPLDISPAANSLAVEFAALDFSAPEQNQYAYRLVGFDSGWNETDASRRLAAYTNLPPGSYTLELRGSNRNGAWSAATMRIPLRVLPPWYETWAFRVLEVVLAAGLLAALVQIRTGYLRRRERELELLVDERTAALRAAAIELRQSKAELEELAYRDALTNLPNRRKFTVEFARLLAPAGAERAATVLLLIDLDRFKAINDSLGHDAGDALLIEVAQRLLDAVRSCDCVARLGGDEFAILLDGEHGIAEVDRICERIVASIALPVAFNGAEMRTSASIGIAIAPQHGGTQDELYKSADIALYDAKRGGRDTWRRFEIGHA